MRNSFFLTLFFAAVATASAQRGWTLQECVEYAIEHNIQTRQAAVNTENAMVDYNQSKLATMPSVNGSASNNYNIGRSIDPYTNTFKNQNVQSNSFGLSGNLTLFNGLQNNYTIKQNKNTLLSVRENENAIRNDISLKVCEAYLNILLNTEIVKVNEQQIQLTKEQLDRNQKLLDAGRANMSLVLDVEAQLATEELNLINAKNNLKFAYLNLWQLMLYKPSESDSVLSLPYEKSSLLNGERYDAAALFASFKQRSPEINAARFSITANRFALGAARGGRYPRLTLNAQLSTLYTESYRTGSDYQLIGNQVLYYDLNNNPIFSPVLVPTRSEVTPFNEQISNNYSKFVGFNLSIPIFNGYQVSGNILRAKNNYKLSELTYQNTENTVYQTIVRAVADYEASISNLAAANKNLSATEKSFEFGKMRYEENLLNTVEFNQLKNNYSKSEITLKQAEYQYIFRRKVLEFYKEGSIKF